jgi:hypothetical protein
MGQGVEGMWPNTIGFVVTFALNVRALSYLGPVVFGCSIGRTSNSHMKAHSALLHSTCSSLHCTPQPDYVYQHDFEFGASARGILIASDGHLIELCCSRHDHDWAQALGGIVNKLNTHTNVCLRKCHLMTAASKHYSLDPKTTSI